MIQGPSCLVSGNVNFTRYTFNHIVERAVSVKNGPLLAIVELQGNSTFPPFPTEAYFDFMFRTLKLLSNAERVKKHSRTNKLIRVDWQVNRVFKNEVSTFMRIKNLLAVHE